MAPTPQLKNLMIIQLMTSMRCSISSIRARLLRARTRIRLGHRQLGCPGKVCLMMTRRSSPIGRIFNHLQVPEIVITNSRANFRIPLLQRLQSRQLSRLRKLSPGVSVLQPTLLRVKLLNPRDPFKAQLRRLELVLPKIQELL